jgi:hypothetical protein
MPAEWRRHGSTMLSDPSLLGSLVDWFRTLL